jgi:gliding motility-associated-like protein
MLDAGPNCAEYVWQDGRKGRRYEAKQAGIYAITVKDAHQCMAWDSITLSSKPKPVVDLGHEISVCDPSFELSLPRPFRSYQWQDGSAKPTLRVTGYGAYSVTVTDENYCSNTASVTIVNTCPGIINVPNAFTPLNRDGVNDTFYPVVKNVKSFNFQVYNRWGQLLFESSEINQGWTGEHLNEYMLSDVYIYKVTYTGMDDQTKVVSGDFTLLK